MVKRLLLPAALAMAVFSCGACAGNSLNITVGKEIYGGAEQLTFGNVTGDVQYAVGSYKYTKVNGVWSPPHQPASPGLGYGDIHYKFDAMALFFKPELDYAKFMVVTGMPSTGTTATNVGYGSRQFGPGDLKIDIGSAFPLDEPLTVEVKGRDLVEGIPKTLTLTDAEVREALAETVGIIVDAVRVALEKTPPELSADIMDKGIVLTGGGSMLKNLDKRLREETGLPIAIAEEPLSSVALGTGAMLADVDLLRKISID